MPKVQPHPHLLDREASMGEITKNFSSEVALVEEVIDFGSNLIVDCLPNDENTPLDRIVVVSVLLKQVVSMLDGAFALLKLGSTQVALLQTRSAFEASLYIDAILSQKSEYRARVFYVGQLRRELEFAEKMADYENNYSDLKNEMGEEMARRIYDVHEYKLIVRDEIDRIRSFLAGDKYRDINASYARAKKENRNREPDWFRCLNYSSVRDIAKKHQQLLGYVTIYDSGSQIIHGRSIKDHVTTRDGVSFLIPVRNCEKADEVFSNCVVVALHTFKQVMERYRSADIPEFQKKYVDEWRRIFLQKKRLKYEYSKA